MGESALSLAFILRNIVEHRWMIAIIALVTALLGTIYALSVSPVYESNLLIQVKESSPQTADVPGNLPAALDLKTQTSTEVEVIRSRTVLSRVVEATKLDIVVEPKYFPLIGASIARGSKNISNPGILGQGGYVWGAEKIEIATLNLPDSLLGKSFALTVEDNNGFRLVQKELGIELNGQAGQVTRARTDAGDIEILVEKLAANPGAEFKVSRIPKAQAVEQLQKSLSISERGRQSNIIAVSLRGSKPEQISKVLNQVGDEYIKQNVSAKAAEAEKALSFFKQQLADAKKNLENSEAKVADLRSRNGTFDVNEEARNLMQQSVVVQSRLVELRQKKAELLVRYRDEHPSVVLLTRQIQELNNELGNIKAKMKALPNVDQELVGVNRDRQLNAEMYAGLLNMGKQLGMVEPSRIANSRILDRAEAPFESLNMKRSTMIAVAWLGGIMLGIVVAFLRGLFAGKIHDPREIENSLGLMVSAVIPHSESQKRMYKKIRRNAKEVMLLPMDKPSEGAIESLRILRSTLQFLMRESERNIIMMTGPTPEVGKSFISANFAAVLASIGKKVLLIDADMRTGYLHRYFGLDRTNGLSDMLVTMTNIESFIHKDVAENVDFISTGNFPHKPAELLAHANFGKLLRMLSTQYDYILIDTAPVLDFTDALIVGTHAQAIFNVVREGVSSIIEAEEAVKRLSRAGLTVTGVIVNDVMPNSSRYSYGASRYRTFTPSLEYHGRETERIQLLRS
nr:polysaccharide biosynthesis tyrosine autokinase [Paucimonas lemoignei]